MDNALSAPADVKRKKYITFATYSALLLYGAVVTLIAINNSVFVRVPHGRPIWDYYMSLRLDLLDQLTAELKRTGLYTGLHRLYDHNAVMYLYLSRLEKFLGADAAYTFYRIQYAATVCWIRIIPALWYRATGSLSRAAASSLFFVFFCPYSVFFRNDSYWAGSMMTFVGLPVLYFLFKEKMSRQNFLWALFLAVLSGVANVFRSQAGLGVSFLLIALALVKLVWPAFKEKSKIRAAGAAGLVLAVALFYSLFTNYIPRAYQKITGQPEPLPIKGPWHTLYIGLGWEENPLGIEYLDASGYEGRENLLYDITGGYYLGIESPRYIRRKKADYLSAVKSHPVFFFWSYIRKFFRTFKTVWDSSVINPELLLKRLIYPERYAFLIYLACIPASVRIVIYRFIKSRRRAIKSRAPRVFVSVILFLIGIVRGIVATPINRTYIYGAVAVADCVVLARMVLTRETAGKYIQGLLKKRGKKKR